MGRSDGTRLKDIPAFDRLIPHIMDRRYDATNFAKVEFDMAKLNAFLRNLRAEGHKVGIMDAVIAAYVRLLQKTPELNRFIVNKRIYQRNHICVSFTMLRRDVGGQAEETAVKVYIEPDDELLSISRKIRDTIQKNEQPQSRNSMDDFIDRVMAVPLIPGFLIGLVKWADRRGILPKRIIALSPFHTSMFISNLASIQMNYVYHHLYEFGTTSLFITLGMPRRVLGPSGEIKRMMTLGISLDERICKGATWAKALFEFQRSLQTPERLLGERAEPAQQEK